MALGFGFGFGGVGVGEGRLELPWLFGVDAFRGGVILVPLREWKLPSGAFEGSRFGGRNKIIRCFLCGLGSFGSAS